MKNRNIHKLIRFIILIFFLIAPFYVDAANFKDKKYSLECIYDDGNLYVLEYIVRKNLDGQTSHSYLNVHQSSYPLDVASQNASHTYGETYYYLGHIEKDDAPIPLLSCPTKIYKLFFPDEKIKEEKPTVHISFQENFPSREVVYAGRNTYSRGGYVLGTKSGCFIFCWDTEQYAEPEKAVTHYLVSESIMASDLSGTHNIFVYRKDEPTKRINQASSQEEYINIYVYNDVTLLEKNDRMTFLDGGSILSYFSKDASGKNINKLDPDFEVPKYLYLNDPDVTTKVLKNGQTINSFPAGEIRYSISQEKGLRNRLRYVLTDDSKVDIKETGVDVCEFMPETTIILKQIIGYVVIIVPVLLIVLVALDIARIVTSGNPEEEIPKRKKAIVSRVLSALAIFFLPVIVTLIIDMIGDQLEDGKVIGQIRCLFSIEDNYDVPDEKRVV